MQIRVGCELVYECPQPTPMILMLNIHFTRVSDIVMADPCGQETHAATVEFSGMKTVRERCCHQVTVNVME